MASDRQPETFVVPPLGVAIGIWWMLFVGCGIAAGVLLDALFDEKVMAAFLGVGAGIAILARWRGVSRPGLLALAGAFLRGMLLGSILLSCSLLTWFGVEVLTGGRTGAAATWLAHLALAIFLGALALLLVKHQPRRAWNFVRLALLGTLLSALGLVGARFYFWTGPDDTSAYPPAANSPYRLPWKAGIARLCSQGNRCNLSHDGWQEFAYDFVMPVGAEICAARAGQVSKVIDTNDGNGLSAPPNFVVVRHADGSFAEYVHIRQGGSRVQVGQIVAQGQVICESGNVGYSLSPHLHFHVVQGRHTIPVTFADVPGDGIPRALRRYRSGS